MQIAALPMMMGAIGTIGQTISGIFGAKRSSDQAKIEAKSIDAQTRIAENADRKRSAHIIAKQAAGAAAAGLDISTGSPLELRLDSLREAEMNALNIRYTGQLRKQSKLYEAGQYKAQIPGMAFEGVGKLGQLGAQPHNRRILSDWWNSVFR